MYACVCIHVCVLMYMQVHTQTWRLDAHVAWILLWLPTYFLKESLSLELKLTIWWDLMDGKPQGCSSLQPSPSGAQITDEHCRPILHVYAGDLNWGPPACATSSLSTEQSLLSLERILSFVCLFVCFSSNWDNRKSFHFPSIFIIILCLLNINISILLKSPITMNL